MRFNIMPRIYIKQFTIVHIAKCHSIKSSYFPMSGFRAIICVLTEDTIVPLPRGVRRTIQLSSFPYILSKTKVRYLLRYCKTINHWAICCINSISAFRISVNTAYYCYWTSNFQEILILLAYNHWNIYTAINNSKLKMLCGLKRHQSITNAEIITTFRYVIWFTQSCGSRNWVWGRWL